MENLFQAEERNVEVHTEDEQQYVGTIVGESTSREFRLAIAQEAVREQDIIAVDAQLRAPGRQEETPEAIRIWAKVQRIERVNPLFPTESGHELAATETNPLDTVMSLSREMITAVCQVLGSEPADGSDDGTLDQLRYPAKPASRAYRPRAADIARVMLGELGEDDRRGLDIAHLANRDDIDVRVDGHAVVSRHLAILAMTGAGKSWTARRIIEQLAERNYPIVIFDPHGDYTGLADVPALRGQVQRYYARLPVFEEDADKVVKIVESLAWELSDNQRLHFDSLFQGAAEFLRAEEGDLRERENWLADYLGNPDIRRYGIQPNLYFLADFVRAVVTAGKEEDSAAFSELADWCGRNYEEAITKQVASWIEGLPARLGTAAKAIRRMESISQEYAEEGAEALPTGRTELVNYGQISIISLGGYTEDFQATIYSIIASDLFDARVRGELQQRALFLLEEAHKFAPAKASGSAAKQRAITISKQIAQEGRKFGVGMILISQRPSRLDETTLSMCNSNIIMRMVNPADQRHVRQSVESLGEDEANILPDLETGEAILSGQFVNFPVLVKMKPPVSRGEREEEEDAFSEIERIERERR